MTIDHLAASSRWMAIHDKPREEARYPTHGMTRKDGAVLIVICAAALVLPSQVPVRDARAGMLFCVGCSGLVPVAKQQFDRATLAARAEGHVGGDMGPTPIVPGTLSADVRVGLYWAFRLLSMSSSSRDHSRALDAIKEAASEMGAVGFYEAGSLTPRGRDLAALIADPPVPAALARTSSAKYPAPMGKGRTRVDWIAAIVHRCGTSGCWSPVNSNGACSRACGYVERDAAKLVELATCWAIVDQRAPEKAKRQRKCKPAGALP